MRSKRLLPSTSARTEKHAIYFLSFVHTTLLGVKVQISRLSIHLNSQLNVSYIRDIIIRPLLSILLTNPSFNPINIVHEQRVNLKKYRYLHIVSLLQ